MPTAFLSHVREDHGAAAKLAADLKVHGISTWLDRNDIQPGVRWKESIRNAIRSGDYFIACFSDAYARRQRTYMHEELTLAIDELRQRAIDSAWFIPIKLSPCTIPDRRISDSETLRDLQWVDLAEDWSDGVARILSVLRPSTGCIEINPEVVAHFTRNLFGCLNQISARAERLATEDRMREELHTIRTLAAVASLGVKNFKAVTYIFQGNKVLFKSQLDLVRELRSAVAVVEAVMIPAKDISITLEPQDLSRHVFADASMMSQVFFNLLDNAVRYSYAGKPVVVNGEGTLSDEAVINVVNYGIPISKDEARQIFDFGYRGQHAQFVTGSGMGLGLYIAKLIVEWHGGVLRHVSDAGTDRTLFQIRLPLNLQRSNDE